MTAQENTGEWTPVPVDHAEAVGGKERSAHPARWSPVSFSHFPGVCVQDLQSVRTLLLSGSSTCTKAMSVGRWVRRLDAPILFRGVSSSVHWCVSGVQSVMDTPAGLEDRRRRLTHLQFLVRQGRRLLCQRHARAGFPIARQCNDEAVRLGDFGM